MTIPEPTSLLDALALNAIVDSGKDAIRFLGNGEAVTDSITHGALLDAVSAVATGLLERDLAERPVLLATPPGIECAVAFLGCLMARAIAVTIPFPITEQGRERVRGIIEAAAPAAVVKCGGILPEHLPLFDGIDLVDFERLVASRGLFDKLMPGTDMPAFVQYSSGSTRKPAGVVVTHGNLAANLEMIRQSFEHDRSSIGVNWLPPSHDMGLVGCILQSVWAGCTTVLMPPQSFILKPIRWLRAIEAHGASTAGGPNFGYDLCCRRITEKAAQGLDLRSWKVAFCGAEPIRPATLEAFRNRFQCSGFRAEAFMPCYGLAEATLLVSTRRAGTGARVLDNHGSRQVACGSPPSGSKVLLVDEANCEVSSGPGEISVSGGHVSPGLWSGKSRSVVPYPGEFVDRHGNRYVRTGDIGKWHDGEIVVCGRLKDICIVNGRKIHAEDIEADVLAPVRVEPIFAIAAVSRAVRNGEELVILCELETRPGADVIETFSKPIADAIAVRHGIVPRVVLLWRGCLPRTSSGKIRRSAALQMLDAGELRPL